MIGIVGGGISGLFLLHLLRKDGIDAVLFESSDEPGGVMRSRIVDGPNGPVAIDLGPQRTRLTPGFAQIVEEIGLTSDLVRAPRGLPFTILRAGALFPAPMSASDALRTPLISPAGKLRALADLVTAPPRPDESVAGALSRKLGPEIYRRLAGPLFGGLYGSDPARMECRHTLLPALHRTGSRRSLLRGLLKASAPEGLPVVSFRDGMGALPRAIATRYSREVRLDDPIREIAPSGNGYLLTSHRESVQADQVVLTLPAPAAARAVGDAMPGVAGSLGALRYNPLAVVPLVVPTPTPVPALGSGYKLTFDEVADTRGVTSHDALFGRPGLFTAFLGGMGQEGVVERADDQILDAARGDFYAATGVEAVPLRVHRTAMPAWDTSWSAMDALELPTGLHLCAAFAYRPGIAGRLEDARRVVALLSR